MGEHTHLISLPEPRPIDQKRHTLPHTLILRIPARAIRLRRCTYTRGQPLRRIRNRLRYSHIMCRRGGGEQEIDGPLPPFECGVVHAYLAEVVEGVPGVDLEGDGGVGEEGEGEVEAVGRKNDISA